VIGHRSQRLICEQLNKSGCGAAINLIHHINALKSQIHQNIIWTFSSCLDRKQAATPSQQLSRLMLLKAIQFWEPYEIHKSTLFAKYGVL
jgi:hypothetical protein